MKIVFLDADTVGKIEAIEQLKQLGTVQLFPFTNEEDVLERIVDADIILTNKVVIGNKHILACQHLKLICITATGMNNVAVDFARKNGIVVKNVKSYAVETVAQHTFATLLHLLHQINYYDRYVKNGSYHKSNIFTHLKKDFYELSGKTIGIIGLGNIGKAVARIAEKGFNMNINYHSVSGKNLVSTYQYLPLDQLLRSSDVVSIHTSLNEQTKNLIDFEKIQLMPHNAIIINMSRGGIIVEKDLVKALNENIIKGACMDVFETEPLPQNHIYTTVKNQESIVLTPHIAWAAAEARQRLMSEVIRQIKEFIELKQ